LTEESIENREVRAAMLSGWIGAVLLIAGFGLLLVKGILAD
jgi:hypothetical protein